MLCNHGAIGRFNAHRKHLAAFLLLDVAGDAANGTAGADSRNQHIDLSLRVFPKFGARGAEVDFGIGRVLELLEHQVTLWIGRQDLFGLGDRAGHAFDAVGEHQVGAQRQEYLAPLDGKRLRHGQGDCVTAGSGHKGEGAPCVSAGWFDQLFARLEDAPFFGVPDHRRADAALDGITGIAALNLGEDDGFRTVGDTVQAHKRRVPDAQGIVVVNSHESDLPIQDVFVLFLRPTAKQIAEGGLIEDAGNSAVDLLPDVVERVFGLAAGARTSLAAAFDKPQNLADAKRGSRPRQQIAAFGAAAGLDKSALLETRQNQLQKFLGYLLAARNLRNFDWLARRLRSEIKDRQKRVLTLHGDVHQERAENHLGPTRDCRGCGWYKQ